MADKCCGNDPREPTSRSLTIKARPESRQRHQRPSCSWPCPAHGELAEDPDCWVVIVTGSGDKAFSAGMDLKAFQQRPRAATSWAPRGASAAHPAREVPKRPLPAVNGSAPAGGFEIMLSCAPRRGRPSTPPSASPRAKRGLIAGGRRPHIRMPKPPWPIAIALEMAMTGDPIDATRATSSAGQQGGAGATTARGGVALAERDRRQRAAGPCATPRASCKRPRGLRGRGPAKIKREAVGSCLQLGRRHGRPIAFAEKRPPNCRQINCCPPPSSPSA